jgi:pyridoxal 5'-phosphate synthase pdxT subunit
MNTLRNFEGGGGTLQSDNPANPSPQAPKPLTIGVLALQGAFEAHAKALTALGVTAKLIRTPAELQDLDGLIIPGGESTTFLKFLERGGFLDTLQTFVETTPTFGTCAGAILLAKDVQNPAQPSLAALDVTVERNAYGRQIDSAIITEPTKLEGGPLEMVFIRAPRITNTGPKVETLATRDGFPVLVREGHLLAATFHPELSNDPRVHQLFLNLVRQYPARRNPVSQNLARQDHGQ